MSFVYMVARPRPSRASGFEDYKARAAPVIAAFGGRVVAAEEQRKTLLVAFDSINGARRCFASPRYRKVRSAE